MKIPRFFSIFATTGLPPVAGVKRFLFPGGGRPVISGLQVLLFAGALLVSPAASAEDEICSSCGRQVSVRGSFTHRKDGPSVVIEGATNNAAAFREEINGTNFTVTIAHLPAGKYAIVIGEVETLASGPGERLFDVPCLETVLAKDFDIFTTAGGARKACQITGVVEHEDDSLKGPLAVSFAAGKGAAKFNTFEVKDAAGASVVSFCAPELADAFSAAATRAPDVPRPGRHAIFERDVVDPGEGSLERGGVWNWRPFAVETVRCPGAVVPCRPIASINVR
jgi:hypothetical protein